MKLKNTNCKWIFPKREFFNFSDSFFGEQVNFETENRFVCRTWKLRIGFETQYETVKNTNCKWICPKCEFFNFSGSFFGEQVNLETENRFVPLTKEKTDKFSPCATNKNSFISWLKFISMNISIA